MMMKHKRLMFAAAAAAAAIWCAALWSGLHPIPSRPPSSEPAAAENVQREEAKAPRAVTAVHPEVAARQQITPEQELPVAVGPGSTNAASDAQLVKSARPVHMAPALVNTVVPEQHAPADDTADEHELAQDEDLVLRMYHAMGQAIDRYAKSDCKRLGTALKGAVQDRENELERVVSAHRTQGERAIRFQQEHKEELEELRSKVQTGLTLCGTDVGVRDAVSLLSAHSSG